MPDEPIEVTVIPPEPGLGRAGNDEEEEIDSLAELTAAEAIICEERHEETMGGLASLMAQVQELQQRQAQLQEALNSSQLTESPQLNQLLTQQAELKAQLESLRASMESMQSSLATRADSTPAQPAPGATGMGVSMEEPKDAGGREEPGQRRRIRRL